MPAQDNPRPQAWTNGTGGDTLSETVSAARRGDLSAFEWLVERFQDVIYAAACARTGDHQLAEDVAQATFVQAFLSLGSLRGPAAFGGWLRRVMISKCRDVMSKHGRRCLVAETLPDTPTEASDPAERLRRRETLTELHEALWSLTEPDREVLTLFYLQEMSVRDLAEWVGLSAGAARKRLHTARRRLRRRMETDMRNEIHRHRPSRDERFAGGVRDMLVQLCGKRLGELFPEAEAPARRRWEQEARQLEQRAGQSFWEVAWRVVRFMNESGIPFGPGRGRMPQSLIAFLLGVSRVNPLRFGLSYAPDPDPEKAFLAMDVCRRRIDEVVAFVGQAWPGRVGRFDRWRGEPCHELIITPDPLSAYGVKAEQDANSPAMLDKDQRDRLVEARAVRLTVIGSRTVTHIHAALKEVQAAGKPVPNLDDLDWDDPASLKVIADGLLDDVLDVLDWNFIVKRQALRRIRPESFEQLATGPALLCRLRTEPDLLDEYARRKSGQSPWSESNPLLRQVLAPTFGLLLYDEQLAAILHQAAGWEMWSPRMWQLQEAIYEQDAEAVARYRRVFGRDAAGRGIGDRDADAIWDKLTATRGW
ncbi:MAG: RNA polymerase sigma factor, partial [Planctomycetota bacterium]